VTEGLSGPSRRSSAARLVFMRLANSILVRAYHGQTTRICVARLRRVIREEMARNK
jgi:hypothetical protein